MEIICQEQVGALALTEVDARDCAEVIIAQSGLGLGDTIPISIAIGPTYQPWRNGTAVAVELTDTITEVKLPGGPIYGVSKGVTASVTVVVYRNYGGAQ